jgi:hypothetical protein
MSSDLEGDLNQDGIIRGNLNGEIENLGESVRTMFDWKAYVKSAPLTSVGIAVAVGYLFAPRIFSRKVSVVLPEPVIPEPAQRTIVQTLLGVALAGAARVGTAYVSDLVTRTWLHPDAPDDPSDRAEPSGPPFDVGV